jgi:sugar lactone lactonase YvrE
MLRRALAALTLAFCALGAQSQSIVTIAGGGTLDGQRLSDLFLSGTSGLAFDPNGNLLLTLSGGSQVLRIDAATGIVTTVAGNGASGLTGDGSLAVNAALRQIGGVAADSAGNVYVADRGNERIRRIDAKTGIITTFAGGGTPQQGIGDGGPATAAYLGGPWGVIVDHGFLYITESAYDSNRVRRVNLADGIITTVAGATDGSRTDFGGDGGPAKDAKLGSPYGIVADAAGNLYFADRDNGRIRRIDIGSGIITTYAGGGPENAAEEGIAATAAHINTPIGVALDPAGNILLTSLDVGVRRVDKNTGIIRTVYHDGGLVIGLAADKSGTIFATDGYVEVNRFKAGATEPELIAGNGKFVGDGRSAEAAILHSPQGIALDRSGNLYIVDQQASIIRKVDVADGSISTVAGVVGNVYAPPEQEGTPAKEAAIGYPTDIAFDTARNLYIADELNGKVWRVDTSGKLTTFAGGGEPADGFGDNDLATKAKIIPWGISLDAAGNMLIADNDPYGTPAHARIRRVDAATKNITTIAGTSTNGFSGDGGPATQAQLDRPLDAVADADGNIFIADYFNGAIRRIDKATGNISTYAGHVEANTIGDGGPASQAPLTPLHLEINRANGDLYVPDFNSQRLRKIDKNGIITTIAGSALYYFEGGFGGDNGPALQARLSFDYGDVSGVAIDAAGDLYFADSQNNRIRAVLACHTVGIPQLLAPANNAVNTSTAPKLAWSRADFAFRYDVRLDTVNPPIRTIATNVDATSFTPSNLQTGTKYFWQVVAKGDSYCATNESGSSAIGSFTTGAECGAGSFDLISPADGSAGLTPPVQLTWQASTGAATYDLYLGTTNPPPLSRTGLTTTTFDTGASGTTYWFVVAHAGCDATKTATSPIRSFSTPVNGNCGIVAASVSPVSPANGATNVAVTTEVTWNAIGTIEAFDVYFGTTSPPPLLIAGLPSVTRSVTLPSLATNTKYYWGVTARGACLPALGQATAIQSFTTRADCPTPGAPSILFAPATATVGSTYAIVWSSAATLGDDGGYLVERSTNLSFSPILDAQVTGSTAASFLATSTGTIYHRIRAVPGCDPTKTGPPSETKSVVITEARPNVIFTVQPQAVVTSLGQKLEDRLGTFTLENIGSSPVQVIVGQSNIDSPPFFEIVGQTAFLTLEPRKPKTFTIRYGGPRNDVAASYQGVVFVAATGTDNLVITPYAFVNLRVGTGPAGVPKFVVDGVPSDYAAFPGFAGNNDASRPARQVTIRNDGTSPMELAAEIGPEVWLTPQSGWNDQPLAPGASRTVNLLTQRARAPNSSPLPRYTYFTVRTKDGASARLLVQDSDALTVRGGRATGLDVTARSFVIPDVASTSSTRGTRLVTRARLSNLGGDAVQAELIFTPAERDGFDAATVRRTVVVVPANDVVTITDPIVQLFGLTAPLRGQIEVRLPRERVGLVTVRSSIVPLGAPGGFDTPVVSRGDGARSGAPHVIYLPPSSTVSLALAETSGNDGAAVQIKSYNAQGGLTEVNTATLRRYGMTRINSATASRIEIVVDSGGGAVTGLATIANATGEGGATILSRPVSEGSAAQTAIRRAYATATGDAIGDVVPAAVTPVSVTTVVPLLGSGSLAYKTSVGFVAPPSSSATFTALFHGVGGGIVGTTRTVTVPAGGTQHYNDIVAELFGGTSAQGSVFVTSPSVSKVYAVVNSGTGTPSPSSYINLPTTLSEALTSVAGAALRPLAYDGLEQNADTTKGDRWLLVLNEVAGSGGNVNVRLYEAANRTSPIAEKDFTVAAYQQLSLDSIFGALGLEAADRKKDRTNVQVVVTATGGAARLSGTAVAISTDTGEARSFALTPAVGSGTPNINFVTPITVPGVAPAPPRRRAVKP